MEVRKDGKLISQGRGETWRTEDDEERKKWERHGGKERSNSWRIGGKRKMKLTRRVWRKTTGREEKEEEEKGGNPLQSSCEWHHPSCGCGLLPISACASECVCVYVCVCVCVRGGLLWPVHNLFTTSLPHFFLQPRRWPHTVFAVLEGTTYFTVRPQAHGRRCCPLRRGSADRCAVKFTVVNVTNVSHHASVSHYESTHCELSLAADLLMRCKGKKWVKPLTC